MALKLNKCSLFMRRCLGCITVIWIMLMLSITVSVYQWNAADGQQQPESEIIKILDEVNRLQQQNQKLNELANKVSSMKASLQYQQSAFKNSSFHLLSPSPPVDELVKVWIPSLKFEETRRKTEWDLTELQNFVGNNLLKIKQAINTSYTDVALQHIEAIQAMGRDIRRTIVNDIYNLTQFSDYEEWRSREAKYLSELVQSRLHALQNPADCGKVKRLLCTMNKGCGYGCQIHHVAYCLITAYGTGRTMVLDSRSWRYAPDGWDKFFQPVSEKCKYDGEIAVMWSGGTLESNFVMMPIIDNLSPRPPFLPQAVPRSIARRLARLHGHPFVWWLGQVLKYLLRPQPQLFGTIVQAAKDLKFFGPIVGVHVRRTDKVGTEAAYHSLEEYMKHVEEYFDTLSLRQPGVKRRIYLASDDPSVIEEAIQKYPNYDILNNPEFSKSAAMSVRYSEESLRSIILEIHFLSETDYLVCTFSSQVCRMAYELMQTRFPDASRHFKSLDDIFYFGGQDAHNQVAVMAHQAQRNEEISLEVGDLIGIAGNHWNGYSKGTNRRTFVSGLYPSYKAVDVMRVEDFAFDDKFEEFS